MGNSIFESKDLLLTEIDYELDAETDSEFTFNLNYARLWFPDLVKPLSKGEIKKLYEVLNLHRISLTVFEYNPRAIRSYEKAGFRVEGQHRKWVNRDGKRWDMISMGILQSEWREDVN